MFSDTTIQQFRNLPTPFYYYDMGVLQKTLARLKNAASKYNYKIHYAVKANANNEILQAIRNYGIGADCVSGNEILKAIENGFNPSDIAFAGVGKTDYEINIGLENNIFSFNCESIQEVEIINDLAKKLNKTARIALRINPNVDAHTHSNITTGLEENKFGFQLEDLSHHLTQIESLKNIKLVGIHTHVGSQITDLDVYKNLCLRINEIQEIFYEQGFDLEHINVGGGLGIDYLNPENDCPDFETYFGIIHENLIVKNHQSVHFELGRSIVGQCGTLISRVLYVKKGKRSDFVIVDAGFTELIRPALYNSYHKIENLTSEGELCHYDVVGPICESTDCFAKSINLPFTQRNDIIAIRSAGAYGQVMASQYNLRNLVTAYYSDRIPVLSNQNNPIFS